MRSRCLSRGRTCRLRVDRRRRRVRSDPRRGGLSPRGATHSRRPIARRHVRQDGWVVDAPLDASPARKVGRGSCCAAYAERYQRAVQFIHHPPGDCRVLQIAPTEPLATRRTTQDVALLKHDYALGRIRIWSALASLEDGSIDDGDREGIRFMDRRSARRETTSA